MVAASSSSPFAGRLMVVADRAQLIQQLQQRYPAIEITSVPSYMSGIAELAGEPVHAIMAYVDPAFAALDKAVRGLRTAAGESVPLVLCCEPEGEPVARRALAAGATDYVIYPPQREELDDLLRLDSGAAKQSPAPPVTAHEEMQTLGKVLDSLSASPHRLLSRMAELLTVALSAKSAEVAADGVKGHAGQPVTEAVLREPILSSGQTIGEVTLGEPTGDGYGRAEVDKLRYYCGIFSHLLHAAKQQHDWKHLALTDDLTSLPNRRYLIRFLDRILQRAARERFRVTVCMFDIDNFKQYNDQFGYAAGDDIIRSAGQMLLRRCRVDPFDVRAHLLRNQISVRQSPRLESG